MLKYSRELIAGWIDSATHRTANQCENVLKKAGDWEEQGTWRPGPTEHERLVAALFTGKPMRLMNRQIPSNWASWIEGRPFYLSLSTHPTVVVDLVPCKDEDAFLSKYGCTSKQFVTLLLKKPDWLRINIRNDDPGSYAESESMLEVMGNILSLVEHEPTSECFYRLEPIRLAVFRKAGVDFESNRQLANTLCQAYKSMFADLQGQSARHLDVTTRDRPVQWMPYGQLVGRMAYYLSAKRMWPEEAGDPIVDEWVGTADKPLAFPTDLNRLSELFARVYTTHHLYTAPLTGALGGTYAWDPAELDFSMKARTRGEAAFNTPLSTWLFDLQAGIVSPPTVPVLPHGTRLGERPSDTEWADFLAVVDENRESINRYWKMLEEAFLRASYNTDPTLCPDVNLDDLDVVLDRISMTRFESIMEKFFSAVFRVAGSAATDATAKSLLVNPKLLTTGGQFLGEAAARELEQFKESVGKFTWRRTARASIMKAIKSVKRLT